MKIRTGHKAVAVGISLALLSSLAFANNTMSSVVAKVKDVGVYGDGSIYVFFDKQISSCSSTSFRLDLEPDHPAKDHVFSSFSSIGV